MAVAAHDAIEEVRDQAMFLIDRQGRIASWNEGVARILGWDKADWIGQPLAVAFTPQDVIAGVHEDEMRRAAASGRADDDRWMRRKNGEHFFALGAMTHVLDAHGALVGYLKMLRDFTDAKKAAQEREQLLVSESQARALAENQAAALTAAVAAMADGVFIGDANGVQRCNDAARRMLGAQAAQALPLDVETLLQCLHIRRERHGPLLSAAEFPFTRALHGHTEVLELWATRLDDGQDVFLRSAAAPITVDGRVVGAVAVHSDLTEHLRLHEQGHDLTRVQNVLHERNAELRALADGVRDYAIFTVNNEGRISSWHQGASLMKGHTAEEAIGMPFANLFTPEDRAAGKPGHEMAVAAATGEYKGDGRRVRKDGSTFESAVVLTALRGPRHELLGYLKLTQDITARKHLEREREVMLQAAQAARSEAERTSHSKGEFLATISHELRTPLSAILGWAHVLDRGVFDLDTVKHGLAAISRNARIQVQLIEDLLDMNRIESGQLRLDLQRVELGGVIAAAIDSALPAADAKGIGLHTAFGPEAGAVMGDAARLQQVVANLLNNAIKFTPEGGQVSVTLTQSGAQAQIVVNDNGQGIAPDFVAHIFDRFQQQDATTTRRHGGLGIGLAIVRNLVQLHGGSVAAHSRGNGHGATFTVTLPALTATADTGAGLASTLPAAQGQTEPAAAPGVRLDGLTVLLVDDEPDVRAITARVLQDVGAQVLTAGNADEGLALLRSGRPAVILSDIGMPQVDGYDFMRRVRALPGEAGGQTPAASFTAYTRPEDHQRALAAGYQMHLDKPVSPDALVSAVAALAGYGAAAAASLS